MMLPSSKGWNSTATTVSEDTLDSSCLAALAQSQTERACSGPSSTAARKTPPSVLEKERQETGLAMCGAPNTWMVARLTLFQIRMWGEPSRL